LIRKGDFRSKVSGDDAIDLYLAAKKATEKGPVISRWEAAVIEDVVTILERHPVSENKKSKFEILMLKQRIAYNISMPLSGFRRKRD
jgi:hypothetical protein